MLFTLFLFRSDNYDFFSDKPHLKLWVLLCIILSEKTLKLLKIFLPERYDKIKKEKEVGLNYGLMAMEWSKFMNDILISNDLVSYGYILIERSNKKSDIIWEIIQNNLFSLRMQLRRTFVRLFVFKAVRFQVYLQFSILELTPFWYDISVYRKII